MGVSVPGARLIVARLPPAGESCRIAGEEAAHARARRVVAGDAVVLVDGSGVEALARVVKLERGSLDVRVESLQAAPAGTLPPIHLLVAAIRAERLAWIAEKAVELGAARLTLVASERTQRFRATEAILPRLTRVVREAAKQAELARWAEVAGPRPLMEALEMEDAAQRLLLDPRGEPFPGRLEPKSVALLVGPEGGWSDAEVAAARDFGWLATSLPAGKLRAETAAVAALTLTRAALARIPH